MLTVFWDHTKDIELLTNNWDIVPEVKDTVLIRGVFYTVVRKTFDYNEPTPVCRIDCEPRV